MSNAWKFKFGLILSFLPRNIATSAVDRAFLNVLTINKQIKVKDSCNRPRVAQRVPGGLGSQIS
jgi:hypothetical protein